jgi:hypothetical protein
VRVNSTRTLIFEPLYEPLSALSTLLSSIPDLRASLEGVNLPFCTETNEVNLEFEFPAAAAEGATAVNYVALDFMGTDVDIVEVGGVVFFLRRRLIPKFSSGSN